MLGPAAVLQPESGMGLQGGGVAPTPLVTAVLSEIRASSPQAPVALSGASPGLQPRFPAALRRFPRTARRDPRCRRTL